MNVSVNGCLSDVPNINQSISQTSEIDDIDCFSKDSNYDSMIPVIMNSLFHIESPRNECLVMEIVERRKKSKENVTLTRSLADVKAKSEIR